MRLAQLLILFLITFGLYCCEKENDISLQSKLTGKWEWKSSVGGLTGTLTVLPTSKVILILNADKTFQLTSDGQLTDHGNYSIITISSIFTQKNETALDLNNANNGRLIEIRNDSLFLTDNHVEPYRSLYLKVK